MSRNKGVRFTSHCSCMLVFGSCELSTLKRSPWKENATSLLVHVPLE